MDTPRRDEADSVFPFPIQPTSSTPSHRRDVLCDLQVSARLPRGDQVSRVIVEERCKLKRATEKREDEDGRFPAKIEKRATELAKKKGGKNSTSR